jgi:hypothetical protein
VIKSLLKQAMQVGMRQDSRGQERKDTFVTQNVEVKHRMQAALQLHVEGVKPSQSTEIIYLKFYKPKKYG